MKRRLFVFFILSIFIIAFFSVRAEDGVKISGLTLKAKSSILMETSTGQILYCENENKKMAPASVTKIMTMLLVMEAIDDGKLSLTDIITCSEHASSMGGTQIWLEPGEKMSIDDLLKATAVASANDASVALAEAVAGSEGVFVEMMNKRANELGMSNTEFKNATGLDAQGHVTTAKDIAIMSRELLKHNKIVKYTTIWMDTLRSGQTSLVNTNKLVRFYEGTTGLKTRTTDEAGSCLSASAIRNSMSLVAVVMGSSTSDDRFDSAKTLLNYGFSNWELYDPSIPEGSPRSLKVIKGVKSIVGLSYDSLKPYLIPKGRKKDISYQIQLPKDLMAPIEQGQIAGTLTILLDNKTIAEYPIKAEIAIEKMTFLSGLMQLLKAMIGIRQ